MCPWTELPLPGAAERLAIKVRRVAAVVHREVGAGFRESVYERCFAHALREAGCVVQTRVPLTVNFRGLSIRRAGEADVIVDGMLVVELKAREAIHASNTAQLLGYVRAANVPIGLLFNFHAPVLMKHGYRRVVHPKYLTWGP